MPFIKFEKLRIKSKCKSPEHMPPTHQYVVEGGTHTWQCPLCKEEVEFTVPWHGLKAWLA